NVVGLSRAVGDDYFIQDDLGSPMSVINQRGDLEEAYAYDEFGQEYCNIIDARNRFQPLSYTGYQKEAVGDTYFAQARRYDASIGRFVSEDKIKGNIILPISLNAYAYCWNRSKDYVDLDGKMPTVIAGAIVGGTVAGVFELGAQLIENKGDITKIDLSDVGSAALGGAVTGAIIGACPAAAVPGTPANIAATSVGNNVQRITSGLAHGDSAKEIAVDVVAGTATDVVFGKLGAKMKKLPVTKELNKLFDKTHLSQIGKKGDRYYRTALTRAKTLDTEVTWKTVRNGIKGNSVSEIRKRTASYFNRAAKNSFKSIVQGGLSSLTGKECLESDIDGYERAYRILKGKWIEAMA
ncbi:MAG: hypothetical protein J6O60_01285, partial [Lachnospiraceae bacterium]|nr:hypothetical protein [Lachnospiraceae bacterium]